MVCLQEVDFVAKSLDRMKMFLIDSCRNFRRHRNSLMCVSKDYLRTLFYFVFDKEFPFKTKQTMFVKISLTYFVTLINLFTILSLAMQFSI